MTQRHTLPLVLSATARAIAEAKALGIHRPLENVVSERIQACGGLYGTGHVRVGQELQVALPDHHASVTLRCARSLLSKRRGWIPVSVARAEGRRVA